MLDEFDEDEITVFSTTIDPKYQTQTIYIKDRRFLYLLFYVSEEHEGKNMIKEAAQTRFFNIRKQNWYNGKTNRALVFPIKSIDEVLKQIPLIIEKHSENNTKKVVIQELGFFSHADWDGPISYNTPVIICPLQIYVQQMDMCGWEQIQVKWAKNAKCVFYGCNTSNPHAKNPHAKLNFAQNISNLPNFKNVEVWGQPSFSYPSFYPDYIELPI